MRIGQGWDIHRLEGDKKLILGGVLITEEFGSVAHSDGDALAHAIIDALLGAAALGDIGYHFPDTDPEFKNADSLRLLSETSTLIKKEGLRIGNIDSTVILQRPKLKPFIKTMRQNIADAAGIEISCVSIKAKTNENLGETGKSLAVEAQAAVILTKV